MKELCLLQNQQKQAVIIGAFSGICEALVRQLAKDGWRVIIAARRMERLQAMADELGNNMLPYYIDASAADFAGVKRKENDLNGDFT